MFTARFSLRRSLWMLLLLSVWQPAHADPIHVAVAANFKAPLERLADVFQQETGHEVLISSASTGKLFAQIVHGAPFDLFLAADDLRPARLEGKGLVAPGFRRVYAVGRLVLWSPDPERLKAGGEHLLTHGDLPLALANPETAPYGRAAMEVLRHHGLWEPQSGHLIFGENVSHAYGFAHTGHARAAFVAHAQVLDKPGAFWMAPAEHHAPIRQEAVLLAAARDRAAARALWDYLFSPPARALIGAMGYAVPPTP